MTDFKRFLSESKEEKGSTLNPFSGKNKEGEWEDGFITFDYLNKHFSQFETAEEMKKATESEGLKLYFDWLKQKGILN